MYNQKIWRDAPFMAARLMNGRKGLFPHMPFNGFVEWSCSEEGMEEKADSHWLSHDHDALANRTRVSLSGVGHLLHSGAAAHYRTVYTDRTAKLVVQHHMRDIALFGYRLDGSKSDGEPVL